jgi:sulfur-carrier protein
MAVTVRIPTPLRKHTEGLRQAAVEAASVAEAVAALLTQHPALRAGLYRPDGALRPDVRLFVGSDDIRSREGLDTTLTDGDTLSIVPPVAGA